MSTLVDVRFVLNDQQITTRRPADELLLDFLNHQAGLTGTKYGCGIGSCGACTVIAREENDGPPMRLLACFARMGALDGLHITTIEGIGDPKALSPIQQRFLNTDAFQCGYCTPGMVMASHVLLERAVTDPVEEDRLDAFVREGLFRNLCRCTGYRRYVDALKAVIEDSGGTTPGPRPAVDPGSRVTFRLSKQSGNDTVSKVLIGQFRHVVGQVAFGPSFDLSDATGRLEIPLKGLSTGIRVRDLNLRRFFFVVRGAKLQSLHFELRRARYLDPRVRLDNVAHGELVPLAVDGVLRYGSRSIDVAAELFVAIVRPDRLQLRSRSPVAIDLRDLELPSLDFMREFGLQILGPQLEVSLDVKVDWTVHPKLA